MKIVENATFIERSIKTGWRAGSGAISGALAKFSVYPLDTVKRRLMAEVIIVIIIIITTIISIIGLF